VINAFLREDSVLARGLCHKRREQVARVVTVPETLTEGKEALEAEAKTGNLRGLAAGDKMESQWIAILLLASWAFAHR
jgi:hypothetical protein